MKRPTSPTVTITGGDMIEALRTRGLRSISPEVSLSRPSAMPIGAVIRKLIQRIWTAENGCPAAMLKMLAAKNVTRMSRVPPA